MRHTLVRLPTPFASNPVFSSDGAMVFGLSSTGDLVSVEVPRDPTASPIPRTQRRASDGAVLAAGWLEGRLATITLVGGELEFSHGEAGVHGQPSSPARISIEDREMRLAPTHRLDPYVRWWQEVNPIEGLVVGIALFRDADDRLFWLSAWNERGQQHRALGLLADEVTALASFEAARTVTFVGRVEKRGRRGALARLRRAPPPHSRGVFVLDGRAPFPISVLSVDGAGPLAGLAGFPTGLCRFTAAVERRPCIWAIVREMETLDMEVSSEHDVVGIVDSDRPALLVRDKARRTLSLSTQRGVTRPLLETGDPIVHVAVSTSVPAIACVAGGALHFVQFGPSE